MGDHVARGSDSTRAAAECNELRDEWRDEQVTAVEKRLAKATIQGMPPLERVPADKQDK
jgi:hypothetical protein